MPGLNHKWNWFQISRQYFRISLHHRFHPRFVVFCYFTTWKKSRTTVFFPKMFGFSLSCHHLFIQRIQLSFVCFFHHRYEQPKCDGNARAHPNKPKDLYRSRHLQGKCMCVCNLQRPHWLSRGGANLLITQNICIEFLIQFLVLLCFWYKNIGALSCSDYLNFNPKMWQQKYW